MRAKRTAERVDEACRASARSGDRRAAVAVVRGCAQAPKLRGQIAGLEKIVEQAERNGAMRCAPRELAMARSHLQVRQHRARSGLRLQGAKRTSGTPSRTRTRRSTVAAAVLRRARLRRSAEPAPGDRDGDGYLDPEDKCPDEPENFNGFEDEDGCPDDPDTDGDGILDSIDACVLEPEDKDGYLDEDGCPELDNDLDALLTTAATSARSTPEDPDGFEDDDGCPDPDNDKDTVLDVEDQCPNELGSTAQEPLGCPTKPALVVVTDCEVKITQQIHFEFNKDKIRPESFPVLDAVVEVLQKNPEIKIEVQGHTDNKGSRRVQQGPQQSARRLGAEVPGLRTASTPTG